MDAQTIPSQDLINCKICGALSEPNPVRKLWCTPCTRRKNLEYTRKHRQKVRESNKERTCGACGVVYFPVNGRSKRCPACVAKQKAEYERTHKDKAAAAQKRYRERLGEKYKTLCVERRKQRIAEMTPEQLAAFRQYEKDKTKRLIGQLKDEAFRAYGGWRCACCGETERMFLTIDHINGDGRKMREVHGQTGQFYRWLKKFGYPPGFQILCINCNFGKHQNGGICPHQVRRNDYPERE